MIFLLTGRKAKLSFFLLLSLGGCISVLEPNSYTAYVVNSTSDSLYFLNNETRDITTGALIAPNESVVFEGNPSISEEVDPVLHMFNDNLEVSEQTVEVIGGDSVLVTWQGPGRSMGESVNHFYNYDSWEVSFERNEFGEGIYTLEFFIGEEDLQGN